MNESPQQEVWLQYAAWREQYGLSQIPNKMKIKNAIEQVIKDFNTEIRATLDIAESRRISIEFREKLKWLWRLQEEAHNAVLQDMYNQSGGGISNGV